MPRKLSGTGPQAIEWNAMVDYLTSLRPIPSSGGTMEHTTFGVVRRSAPAAAMGGSAVPGATRFRVKVVHGDYLTCVKWDGTTEGTENVYVAKPPQLRHSIREQTIDSVSVTYDAGSYYVDGGLCYRKAAASGYPSQDEYVLPVWQTGTSQDSEIIAAKPVGGTGAIGPTGENLEWIDLNVDGRKWCNISAIVP